jgi:hypothetical protein
MSNKKVKKSGGLLSDLEDTPLITVDLITPAKKPSVHKSRGAEFVKPLDFDGKMSPTGKRKDILGLDKFLPDEKTLMSMKDKKEFRYTNKPLSVITEEILNS